MAFLRAILDNLLGRVSYQRYHTDVNYREYVRARRRFAGSIAAIEAADAAGVKWIDRSPD